MKLEEYYKYNKIYNDKSYLNSSYINNFDIKKDILINPSFYYNKRTVIKIQEHLNKIFSCYLKSINKDKKYLIEENKIPDYSFYYSESFLLKEKIDKHYDFKEFGVFYDNIIHSSRQLLKIYNLYYFNNKISENKFTKEINYIHNIIENVEYYKKNFYDILNELIFILIGIYNEIEQIFHNDIIKEDNKIKYILNILNKHTYKKTKNTTLNKNNDFFSLNLETIFETKKYLSNIISNTLNDCDYLIKSFESIKNLDFYLCDRFLDSPRKSEKNIILEINNLESPETGISKFIIFKDSSSLCFFNENKILKNYNEEETRKTLENIYPDILHSMVRKKPAYSKNFQKIFEPKLIEQNKTSFIVYAKNIFDKINKYSKIIENRDFKELIQKNNFKNFEDLEDYIEKKLLEYKISRIEKYIEKNGNSINNDTKKILKTFFDFNFSEKFLIRFLYLNKKYENNTEQFNEYLKETLKKLLSWNENLILGKKSNLNYDIYYHNNNILILAINDFYTSKEIGSPSWCISRTEFHFYKYQESNKKQYFIYNFNLEPSDEMSLIGVTGTYNKNNKLEITHAYDKNNNVIKNTQEIEQFLNIYDIIKTK